MRCLPVHSRKEALNCLEAVRVDPYGIEAMLPKMTHLNIFISAVECRVANIIKQEMLSVGGDAAVALDTVRCAIPTTDVILMGTVKQINRFAEKIVPQPFGMEAIAKAIGLLLKNIASNSCTLQTARREMIMGERTLIMGILNVTPDSFSDGGRFTEPQKAIETGIRMVEEGADIIDVGGESTRPGSDPVSPEEELRRVVPVIRGLSANTHVPISIDTTKEIVAREALAAGAEIVNDISSLEFDRSMTARIAESGAAVIFMHMRGTPKTMQKGDLFYPSLWGEVLGFLKRRIDRAVEAGIEASRIMVDPGLGFGKTVTDNLRLIHNLSELKVLGRPILTGPSRKSFIGHLTGGNPQERLEGTAAAVTAAILNGSHVIRVHDVAAMKRVADMADALVRAE